MADDRVFEMPTLFGAVHARAFGGMERTDQLAIDIELQLRCRGVADADRPRKTVAGKP